MPRTLFGRLRDAATLRLSVRTFASDLPSRLDQLSDQDRDTHAPACGEWIANRSITSVARYLDGGFDGSTRPTRDLTHV